MMLSVATGLCPKRCWGILSYKSRCTIEPTFLFALKGFYDIIQMGNMRSPFIVRATFVYNLYPVTDNPLENILMIP